MRTSEQIKAEITENFGFVPPFFSPAEQAPEVLENLWQQTLAAYVNNPLPALFKEKLSAYLSRYCAIPYCMVCHSCTLRPLGMKAREVLELLESPPPTETNIDEHLIRLATQLDLLKVWPESNSPLEESLLYCSIFIALEQDSSEDCRNELRRILGPVNYQHLVAFIAYVKTCLVWMEAHPEVAYEADKRVIDHLGALLEDEPALADFFRHYRVRVRREQKNRAERLAELAERKRNEEALRQAAAENLRLARAVASVSDGVLIADPNQPDNPIIYTNPAVWQITGYQPDEIVGKNCRFLQGSDTDPQTVAQIRQAITERREVKATVLNYRKDGQLFWNELKISPVFSDEGDLLYFVGIQTDITDRKRAEEALLKAKDELEMRVAERTAELIGVNAQLQMELDERKQAELALERLSRQNQLILNSVGEGLCGLDLQGKITFVNPAATKLLGYPVAELIDQSIYFILPHEKSDGTPYSLTESPIYESLRDGAVHQVTNEVFWRKNNSSFPVEYVSTPIREEGEIIGAVVTFKDITDRQVVERMKDEFISVVSHELRTPLTSIHGSLGMLASGLLDPSGERGKRLLEIAVDSTDRLVRLINDILDIERIESGKVKMVKQACNVSDLMSEAAEVMQAMAEQYGVKLLVIPVSTVLSADRDRIIQTLTNLLSNAIKFSPQGNTIWLTAEHQAEQILFQVKDQGRGIPTDKLETIFERFQQVDASDSRNHEGTGLGLAICRSIVQQHEGRIWVESTLGEGSTFYFTLPILRGEEQATPETDLSRPLVLVCDNDSSTRTMLQTMLQQQNYGVMTVGSGQEAVDQAVKKQPDVILLDLLMPGMNGWEVITALKERADTKDIPIIICSVCSPAESNHPDEGFVDWVSKPLDEASLFQSLKQVVAKSQERVRLLVVEDDTDLAQVIITLFENHDIEIFHAQTGRDAIRLSQELHPDLLILDLILPDRDGFEVVQWLSQHNYLHKLPLVVYSAKDLDDSERHRLKLGQTEFLTKGRMTMQEFEQRVIELLQGITQNR